MLITGSTYFWWWRKGKSSHPLPHKQLDYWCMGLGRNYSCTLETATLCYSLSTLVVWPNFLWNSRKTVKECTANATMSDFNSVSLAPHWAFPPLQCGRSWTGHEWPSLKERQEFQPFLAPFLKLFIQEKITVLLELLFSIELHGFWAAQWWTCSRVVFTGTVVGTFIHLWCLKDLKQNLVVWFINVTSEPVLETRAVGAPISEYEGQCVNLGLPVPVHVVASDCCSFHCAPEGDRLSHRHSHGFVLRHQHKSWRDSWEKRHKRGPGRMGWGHWLQGTAHECLALAALLPHCGWALPVEVPGSALPAQKRVRGMREQILCMAALRHSSASQLGLCWVLLVNTFSVTYLSLRKPAPVGSCSAPQAEFCQSQEAPRACCWLMRWQCHFRGP